MISDRSFESLDSKTQRYLEVVTQKRRSDALIAWLRYVSADGYGRHALSVRGRIELAESRALAWVEPVAA